LVDEDGDGNYTFERRNHSFFNLPKEPQYTRDEYIEEFGADAPFSDCIQENADAHSGVLDLSGAGFCCRVGSFCPSSLIDISCPLGWGFYCKGLAWPGACPENYYCLNPGRAIICPKDHVCGLGSNLPRKCEFWEHCDSEGLKSPDRISGLILASMVLGGMFLILIIGVRVHHRFMMKGRRHLDANFEQRFNAFSRQVKAPLKVFRKESTGSRQGSLDDDSAALDTSADHDENDVFTLDMSRVDDSYDDDMTMTTTDDELSNGPSMLKSGLSRPANIIQQGSSSFGEEDIGSIEMSSNETRGSLGARQAPQGREMKIDIEFKKMSVVLANKQKILHEVSGSLTSGSMTAIMGPSGCGKSA